MIFILLRAGVCFLPSFIRSLNFEMMALEAKSIRMIDSLTSTWRFSTLPRCPPGAPLASGVASGVASCVGEQQHVVFEDEKRR